MGRLLWIWGDLTSYLIFGWKFVVCLVFLYVVELMVIMVSCE